RARVRPHRPVRPPQPLTLRRSIMARPLALVTGASGGIGLELARLLAADGHDLVLVARSADKLARLAAELTAAGARVRVIAEDLATADGASRVVREIEAGLAVDVLVNNAGHGLFGSFTTTSLEAELSMLSLNVIALTSLTKAVLPGMV